MFNDEVFDFVWANGVLHHTKNPRLAFDVISKYLKNNGYILIGLYNRIEDLELSSDVIFIKFLKIFNLTSRSYIKKNKSGNNQQIKAWIRDQYEHPVESLHTLDEVLEWFYENNIEFINSISVRHK